MIQIIHTHTHTHRHRDTHTHNTHIYIHMHIYIIYICILDFLHNPGIWYSKVNLLSKSTPKSFSQELFSISKSPSSNFIFSHELTSKWHLSRLLFMRLSSNHLSRSFEPDIKMISSHLYYRK